jgi:hypothetical protein
VDPVLGGVVVEGEQLLEVVGDLGDGLGELGAEEGSKALTAFSASVLFSAFQICARVFFAAGCADFGSAARVFAILWNQQRAAATMRSPPTCPSMIGFASRSTSWLCPSDRH